MIITQIYRLFNCIHSYCFYLNITLFFLGDLPVLETADGFQCLVCGVVMKHMKNCRRHYMDKHVEQESHVCRFCNKSYKTKHSMETHQYAYHKEEVKSMKFGLV